MIGACSSDITNTFFFNYALECESSERWLFLLFILGVDFFQKWKITMEIRKSGLHLKIRKKSWKSSRVGSYADVMLYLIISLWLNYIFLSHHLPLSRLESCYSIQKYQKISDVSGNGSD